MVEELVFRLADSGINILYNNNYCKLSSLFKRSQRPYVNCRTKIPIQYQVCFTIISVSVITVATHKSS